MSTSTKRVRGDDPSSVRLGKRRSIAHQGDALNDGMTESQEMTDQARTWFSEQLIKPKRKSAGLFREELEKDQTDLNEYLNKKSKQTAEVDDELRHKLDSILDRIKNTSGQGPLYSEDNDPTRRAKQILGKAREVLDIYNASEALVPTSYAEQTAKYKQNLQSNKEEFKRVLDIGRRLAKSQIKKRLGMDTSEEVSGNPTARAIFQRGTIDESHFKDALQSVEKGVRKMTKTLPPES